MNLLVKTVKRSTKFHFTLYDSNLYKNKTLSSAWDMSKNTPVISTLGVPTIDTFIPTIVESNWKMHESLGKRTGWHFVKSSFLIKWLNRSLKIYRQEKYSLFSRILEMLLLEGSLWIGWFYILCLYVRPLYSPSYVY